MCKIFPVFRVMPLKVESCLSHCINITGLLFVNLIIESLFLSSEVLSYFHIWLKSFTRISKFSSPLSFNIPVVMLSSPAALLFFAFLMTFL